MIRPIASHRNCFTIAYTLIFNFFQDLLAFSNDLQFNTVQYTNIHKCNYSLQWRTKYFQSNNSLLSHHKIIESKIGLQEQKHIGGRGSLAVKWWSLGSSQLWSTQSKWWDIFIGVISRLISHHSKGMRSLQYFMAYHYNIRFISFIRIFESLMDNYFTINIIDSAHNNYWCRCLHPIAY